MSLHKPDYLERNMSLQLLHPRVRGSFETLCRACDEWSKNRDNIKLTMFEGYRSVKRQAYLFNQHPRVTKADAWESAHNYGMAADFVFRVYRDRQWQWSWEDAMPWQELKTMAEEIPGLSVPISWDRGHVEHVLFRRIAQHVA